MKEYNPFSLKKKKILITGASSGIGRSIAVECSKMGAECILTARNISRLNDTLKILEGDKHTLIPADLSKEDDLDMLVETTGSIDGLVLNAGILKKVPLKFIKRKSLNDLMDINFNAPVLLTQKLIKQKKINTNSSIVFISSIAAETASLGNSLYMASKGAINSFSKGVALELGSKGIRSNVIQPGLIKTEMINTMPKDALDKYLKKFPLMRFGNPEDIAFASVYLLSDTSRWVTGSIFTIDGGVTLT